MKTILFKTHLGSLAALLLATFATPSLEAVKMTADDVTDPVFATFIEPEYPPGLTLEGTTSGHVEIAIDVDENGIVADWLPIRTTHPAFVRQIGRVIDKWRFDPATREGEAIPIVTRLEFHFTARGVVVSRPTGFFNIEELLRIMREDRLVYDLKELDRIPQPLKVEKPLVNPDIPEAEREGQVVVTFFIDEKGDVRLPVVTEIEGHIDLARAAYAAISEWRFEPPTFHGRPVTTQVMQPIVFRQKSP